MVLRAFTLSLFLMFGLSAHAAPPVVTAPTPAAVEAKPTPFETSFKGKWINTYSSSPHQSGDPNKRASYTSALSVALQTSPEFWVQGGFGFTQIIDPAQKFNLVNPDFRGFYRVTPEKLKPIKIEVGPTTSLALSEETRRESLYFSIGVAARFSLNFQVPDVGGWLFYYDMGFNRNIHQYETSTSNSVNTKTTLNHYLYGEYDFEGPFLIDAWVGFSTAWSYQSRMSTAFTVGQEILFSATDWLDLSVSHERGGDFLSTTGQTYNFGLFDTNESRYAFNVIFYF